MSQNANNIIIRLKEELHISADKEICQLLDIKPNTLSTWKKRETLDFNKVIGLCEERNLDLNYIFFDERQSSDIQKDDAFYNQVADEENTLSCDSKIELISKFELINTNRNLAIFNSIKSEHPSMQNKQLVVGQKVSKKQIKENELYIIEDSVNSFFIDELTFLSTNKDNFSYKFHYSQTVSDQPIQFKNVWRVISTIDNDVKVQN